MTGEIDLQTLLSSMQPALNEGEYVFCTVKENIAATLDPVMTFREREGITLILNREVADKNQIPYSYIASWITLKVHSSLAAVGLTAAFSKALAEQNISCNVVAGYYHDHIFVSKADTEKAIGILTELAEKSCSSNSN